LNFETLVADSINRLSSLKRYLTYYGDTMETNQSTPQEVVTFDYAPAEKTFEKQLFPTVFKSYKFNDWEKNKSEINGTF
jgi:hypothetical protein